MRRLGWNAAPWTLVGLFVGLAVLSGCLGGGKGPDKAQQIGSDTSVEPELPVDPPPVLNDDNTAHHHNYWGELTSVPVFRADVPLETFPLDSLTYEGCNSIGFAKFNFETDGDDAQPGTSAVNPDSGKADVVFPGTKELKVTIRYDDAKVPGLVFAYKPANEKLYKWVTVEGLQGTPCGAQVPNGKPFSIPVKPLQFDPAHQTSLSRWAFTIYTYETSSGSVNPPAFPQATPNDPAKVSVEILSVFGGDTLLDPPHPDFFAGKDALELGTTSGRVNLTLIANPELPLPVMPVSSPFGYNDQNGKEMAEITLPRGRIVPIGALRTEVKACVQYAGTLPTTSTYRLAFHGADLGEFATLAPVRQDSGCDVYQVDDPNGLKYDSPYETISQWAFRIVPITSDQEELGYFEGTYQLTFTAFRKV